MSHEQVAAVDLGSNSFHLQIGRVLDDQIYSLDTLKEPVRLASGLTPDKLLDESAQQRALATLGRFGERLRGFQSGAVRAVATNTLRVAKNARVFLPQAEAALGFPIEVIAGREEARLIYIGAAHALPPTRSKRLVIDIGGGSTEFIIGKKVEPLMMESLYMGCVSYSLRFFPDGKVDKRRLLEAEVSAAREVQLIAQKYREAGWTETAAASGTARAIADLLEMNGLNPGGASGISRDGLMTLRGLLLRAGSVAQLRLDGLRADRVPVLAGGIAIMSAIFTTLGIDRMIYSEGALRLGVLYDLLGRYQQHDMRDATVRQFMRRYQVDLRQAARVQETALTLLRRMVDVTQPENLSELRLLEWSAALHEIGLSISHSGYHKHGAYIAANADMPGFSRKDQERLSFMILGQRGKLERVNSIPVSDALWRSVFCLRLAALLHRSRDDHPLPSLRLRMVDGEFQMDLPIAWLQANPLSAAALADEVQTWGRVGRGVRIRRRSVLEGQD
ncbi:exopolyphosphatase [uncultured Propionivibrio sp.]|uniref:exopolyphosphatase n=1 Tax=uncultured Propionivibrio sp. TaxID=426737 RepID=UPI0029C0D5D9|nr:exopolyphosphatase [uncultured Propionivibrio sp.]